MDWRRAFVGLGQIGEEVGRAALRSAIKTGVEVASQKAEAAVKQAADSARAAVAPEEDRKPPRRVRVRAGRPVHAEVNGEVIEAEILDPEES